MSTWRVLSISIRYPLVDRGTGRTALCIRLWVATSTTPVRGRFSYFWNAHTACWVIESKTPVTPGSQYPSDRSRCCTPTTAAPVEPRPSGGTTTTGAGSASSR